jgi:hypothetical protein
MSIPVEVNLKIPSLTIREAGKEGRRADNGSVRFGKRMIVDALPKPGDELSLSTQIAGPFASTVIRADWSEDKNLFVVSCTYARRSISEAEYHALLADPDWTAKQLP